MGAWIWSYNFLVPAANYLFSAYYLLSAQFGEDHSKRISPCIEFG